ncbi:cbb3-type cytochrome c oxidase subunit I, partial [Candidatus Sumerlaeota bacterium]|nr:cbb3-type cytochrome c oxidase subunit I [Candidatus Sumerlaeota bacterium]
IFALFAGIYYWFPKATGRKMSEFLGKIHFFISIIAINGVFMPMFWQGMAGALRRGFDPTVYDYIQGVRGLMKMTSISAWILLLGQIPFIINFFGSILWGKKVSDNPWDATTLEWLAPSPPPHGNFLEVPQVYRDPYEYSVPGHKADFWPQFQAEEAK